MTAAAKNIPAFVKMLAISAKSGGGTEIDDVAALVDVYTSGACAIHAPYVGGELAEGAFDALVDAVVAAIPLVRFDPRVAAEWSRATRDHAAVAHQEQRQLGFGA